MNDPAPTVVFVLVVVLLAACLYWLVRDFSSGDRSAKQKTIVETKGDSEEPASRPAVRPNGGSARSPIVETDGESDGRAPRTTLHPGGISVEYAIDFEVEPQHGHSRFLHDAASGSRVWTSGWLPQDQVVYRGGVRAGLAHGRGEATFCVGRNDHSPRRIEGEFRDGLFMGEKPFTDPIVVLPANDFLIRLAHPLGANAQFWVHGRFATDGVLVECCGRGTPDLLAVAPTEVSALDENALQDLMKQASTLYRERCGEVSEVRVRVVPPDHHRLAEVSETKFEPLLASATVSSRPGKEMKLYSYQNPEARAAKQSRRDQERAAARERGEKNAPLRGRGPDVRGLRLGMSVEQVWSLLHDDVAEWEGRRQTPGEEEPYLRPAVKIRLKDGARITAEFTSRVSGSQLFVFVYEQHYREGVSPADVIRKLEQRYGKPDGVDRRESGTYWGSYDLVSAIEPRNKAFGSHGAFFRTHVRANHNTGMAEMLRIAFNDATLGEHDEVAVYQARKEEARRRFEESKTDEVKF